MILDRLERLPRYAAIHPGLQAAADYLATSDVRHLPDGKHSLDGQRLLVIVEAGVGRGRAASPLEAHRRYIDLQLVLSGGDVMGWKPTAECKTVNTPFDEDRDIIFFGDQPQTWLAVEPKMFAIFFPDDAHAPLAGEGPLRKAVFKIALNWSA